MVAASCGISIVEVHSAGLCWRRSEAYSAVQESLHQLIRSHVSRVPSWMKPNGWEFIFMLEPDASSPFLFSKP